MSNNEGWGVILLCLFQEYFGQTLKMSSHHSSYTNIQHFWLGSYSTSGLNKGLFHNKTCKFQKQIFEMNGNIFYIPANPSKQGFYYSKTIQ